MSEQAKDTTEETIKYETMPGADAIEAQEGDDLDMNFAFGEEAEETEAEAEVEETEMVRARNEKGHYIADDPNTPENEAWEEKPKAETKKKTTKKAKKKS